MRVSENLPTGFEPASTHQALLHFDLSAGQDLYWLGSAAFHTARALHKTSSSNPVDFICRGIFTFISFLMVAFDGFMLIFSVLFTELLAAYCWFLVAVCFLGCFCFRESANYWHQYIRRICHQLRTQFRSRRIITHPERRLCHYKPREGLGDGKDHVDEDDDDEESDQDKGEDAMIQP